MDRAQIKAIQKQVKEWQRYSEPPAKIQRMIADRVVGWLTEYRQKNTEYLAKQLDNIRTLHDVMAAKSSFIDQDVVSRSSLRFAALPTPRLKNEVPKSYTEALVLAKELRARGADVEADRAAMKAEVLSQSHLYDRQFQDLLSDALTREGAFLAPSMIPTTPIEQITAATARQNLIGVMPYTDIIKQIADGDGPLFKAVSDMVERDVGRSHLPQKLREDYLELSKLRVHTEPTLEDMTAGWDPDRKEKFMESLPPEILEKYKAPSIDMSRLPTEKADPDHDAAVADIARGIIAEERGRIQKEITDLQSTAGGST